MTNAVAASTTLFSLVLLTSVLSFRFGAFRRFMEARPTVLVKGGQLLDKPLGHERIAPEEIFSAMHKAGVERLEQVQWAILEADGKIAIIRSDGGQVQRAGVESGSGARQ